MNAVIYARFSDHTQREESIEGQLRVCEEYAKKHELTIIDTYVDRAMTVPLFKRCFLTAGREHFKSSWSISWIVLLGIAITVPFINTLWRKMACGSFPPMKILRTMPTAA